MKKTIILISLIISFCILTVGMSTGEIRKCTDYISIFVHTVQSGLIQLAEKYPQLSGIEKIKVENNSLFFQNGIIQETKKGPIKFIHKNACQIVLSVNDVGNIKPESITIAATEIYHSDLGLAVGWQVIYNPKGEKINSLRAEIEDIYREAFNILSKNLREK